MTDAELLAVLREDREVAVPLFGGKGIGLSFDDDDHLLEFSDTIRAFLQLGETDLLAQTRHAWAYYHDFVEDVGDEQVDAALADLPPGSPAIWNFVEPRWIGATTGWDLGTSDPAQERIYIVLECSCEWEPEHGFMMSWRDGRELVKVSGFDGHPTNGSAYGDLRRDQWVYNAQNPVHRTTRD